MLGDMFTFAVFAFVSVVLDVCCLLVLVGAVCSFPILTLLLQFFLKPGLLFCVVSGYSCDLPRWRLS